MRSASTGRPEGPTREDSGRFSGKPVPAFSAAPWCCNRCGERTERWQSRCPMCLTPNAMMHAPAGPPVAPESAAEIVRARLDVEAIAPGSAAERVFERLPTGIAGVDRLFNGGLALGTLAVLGGRSGTGKTRLALQMLQGVSGPAALVSGEMHEHAVQLAREVGAVRAGLRVVPGKDLERALAVCARLGARAVVVDSVNRVALAGQHGAPGSMPQIIAVMERCQRWARERNAAVVLLSHATKGGELKGDSDVEHDPDITLRLRLAEEPYRRLVSGKTRLGGPRAQKCWLRFDARGRLCDAPAGPPVVSPVARAHTAGDGNGDRDTPAPRPRPVADPRDDERRGPPRDPPAARRRGRR